MARGFSPGPARKNMPKIQLGEEVPAGGFYHGRVAGEKSPAGPSARAPSILFAPGEACLSAEIAGLAGPAFSIVSTVRRLRL